jgi:AraC family transcriptional regulator
MNLSPDLPRNQIPFANGDSSPTVAFAPADAVRHQTAAWRGVQAQAIQIISRDYYEYAYQQPRHLLIAVEQGVRYDGETFVEGLPTSTVRNYSHKLIFVPAGRKLFGAQHPRLLTRSLLLYIDPQAVAVDPELRFAQADLAPRLLFEDDELWQTAFKLKALIGSREPGDRLYAEALGGVLAHELLRLDDQTRPAREVQRGGLAQWQQKRVVEFMQEHLGEDVALEALADVVRLSPYHFVRSFKQSFGQPPHRYWTQRRIERAKELLASPDMSIIKVALDVGFGSTSAFSARFRKFTGQTPTAYRRSLG